MDIFYQWLQNNIDVVYFIYGLTFVLMGITILIQDKKNSAFELSKIVWLLAVFGLIQGIKQWLYMWEIIKGHSEALNQLQFWFLFAAFLSLFEFGRRFLRNNLNESLIWHKRIKQYLGWQLISFMIIIIFIPAIKSQNILNTATILSRYLLSIIGSLMAGIGFRLCYQNNKEILGFYNIKGYFFGAGLGISMYGILSGIVVPKGDFFPANLLNTESFLLTIHVPVQVIRAGLAIITAWCVVGLLKIFNWETNEKLTHTLNNANQFITELQQTTVSRSYLNNIIHSMIDTLIVLTPHATIQMVNNSACNLLGYHKEELIGQHIDKIFYEKVFFIGNNLQDLFKNGSIINVEKTYISKDGSKIPMICSISILHDKGGNITGMVCVGQDITERKLIDEQLIKSLDESEQKSVYIENIFASIIDSIIVVDLEAIIIKSNKAAYSILGYSETELIGQSIGLIFEHELKEGIYDLITVGNVEKNYHAKTGLIIPVLFSGSILSDSRGKVIGLACVAHDILKIKNLENELKKHVTQMEDMVAERTSEIVKVNRELENSLIETSIAKAFSENIIKSMFEVLIILDKDERIIEVNPEAIKVLGFSKEELFGRAFNELFPFEEKKFLSSFINHELQIAISSENEKEPISENDIISKIETIMVSKDEQKISVILSASQIRNQIDDTLQNIICTAQDITSRKRMEDNIKNNYQLQSAINSLLIIGFNDQTLFEQLNDALRIILDMFSPQLTQGAIFIASPLDEVLYMEAQINLPDALVSMCSKVSFGKCLCGQAASTNQLIFTDQIDDQHENLFENITPHGHYCVPISKGDKVLGIIMLYLSVGHKKNKSDNIFLISAARTLAEIIVRRQSEHQLKEAKDILEVKNDELNLAYEKLKHAQVKLIHNEKMASIGTLAAGVAHEINNPLAYIISNLNSLSRFKSKITEYISALKSLTIEMDSNVTEPIQSLEKSAKILFIMENFGSLIENSLYGAKRIKKIVIGLQGFSRKDAYVQENADINEGIEKTLNIVWNRLKYKVNVIKEYGELPKVKCYIDQLNQVFMNLLVNAADAIEDKGDITISTFKSNGHINISISDTGSGISEENQKDIFSPFFTTKEVGKGTGLGLSISYDIIKEHNGDIEVKSKVGVGTTFIIKIPIDTKQNSEV